MILPAAGRFVVDAEGQVASAVDGYVSVSAEHRSSKTHNDKLRTFSPSSGYVFVTIGDSCTPSITSDGRKLVWRADTRLTISRHERALNRFLACEATGHSAHAVVYLESSVESRHRQERE